jgi:exosortase family protein XrtF
MIEGCNAISIIILFSAFVVSFTGKIRQLCFYFFGSYCDLYFERYSYCAVIFLFIAPQEGLLHGVLFPLFIYGVVFVLWLIWVNNYSYAKILLTNKIGFV